uniref:EF-hand domain-containing protein n=1 Tax=Panagrellus redivivus TaxID=6233 RepID=A0A7E4VSQ0_PANRE
MFVFVWVVNAILVQTIVCYSKSEKSESHDQIMKGLLSDAADSFEAVDVNRDGFLDRAELLTLVDTSINGICFWNPEQVMRLRWAADVNKDEKLSLKEVLQFENWVYRIINMKTMGKRISIERLVRRGDGYNEPYFARLDTNGDGFVDEKEVDTRSFIGEFLPKKEQYKRRS